MSWGGEGPFSNSYRGAIQTDRGTEAVDTCDLKFLASKTFPPPDSNCISSSIQLFTSQTGLL